MALTLPPERPLDADTIAVIRDVKHTADTLGLDTCLVGATCAHHLCSNTSYACLPGRRLRATHDFAFAVENWAQFEALKTRLLALPHIEAVPNVVQRLRYLHPHGAHPFVIDLIPFGDIEDQHAQFAWPHDIGIIMNVAGYRDAHASAIPVEVAPGLTLHIISIAGLAILKLFAWADRGADDPRDALDLLTLAAGIPIEAGNQERLYDEALPALSAADYDIEIAGAWLLGHDARAVTSTSTAAQLNELLAAPPRVERLITDMARGGHIHDPLPRTRALLEQFIHGLGI